MGMLVCKARPIAVKHAIETDPAGHGNRAIVFACAPEEVAWPHAHGLHIEHTAAVRFRDMGAAE
jgi:hypothetical protein